MSDEDCFCMLCAHVGRMRETVVIVFPAGMNIGLLFFPGTVMAITSVHHTPVEV